MTYPNIQTPIARATDPATSHEAAEHMNATGKRKRQQLVALDMVRRHPGLTADELAEFGPLDRYQLNRRLFDLETAAKNGFDGVVRGPKRRSDKTGRNASTWRVKP